MAFRLNCPFDRQCRPASNSWQNLGLKCYNFSKILHLFLFICCLFFILLYNHPERKIWQGIFGYRDAEGRKARDLRPRPAYQTISSISSIFLTPASFLHKLFALEAFLAWHFSIVIYIFNSPALHPWLSRTRPHQTLLPRHLRTAAANPHQTPPITSSVADVVARSHVVSSLPWPRTMGLLQHVCLVGIKTTLVYALAC